MESELRPLTPSGGAPSSNVLDSPEGDAVRQELSDTEFHFPSPTLTQTTCPPSSRLEATTSMSNESSVPTLPAPEAIQQSYRDSPSPGPSQPEEITGMQGEGYVSSSALAPSNSTPTIPTCSTSGDSPCWERPKRASEVSSETPSILYVLETDPILVPLPESDAEDESLSDFAPVERARTTLDNENQEQAAYTTRIDERSSTPDLADEYDVTRPSDADDNQALWVLGDSVLERRDRRVHERWKAGLGVIFVLANILSVLILCIALELYRRIKAAHPGLIAKIRARHIARVGRNSPFSPIVSLLFEADAPFVHSNTAFLAGLCTTLACTLMADLALRWVDRYESRVPPPTASARDRMIARMEWNERIERRAVPWLLDIGIPGLLYISLGLFFAGTLMRAFPRLDTRICVVFGMLFMFISMFALWSFEPALDARTRPKPVSSSAR